MNEAGRRIIGQHWELILGLMLLGVCIAVAMHFRDDPMYTASTRLVLGTTDPKTSSESAGISDTAWALGTAPSNVSAALAKTRVTGREPVEVAKNVSVKAVGASGVLELSVTDRNPRVATALSNAIALQVRRVRLEAGDLEQRELFADIDSRVTAINRRIRQLDARSVVTPRARSASESLSQQRAVLETQRTSALIDASKQPRPLIVSPASEPLEPDPSGRSPDILLGAILGLVLGGGIAALLETLRPTLVGGEALARELGAPLLGTLSSRRTARSAAEAPAVAGRLRLASKAAGVRNIGLLPLRQNVDLPHLADQLLGPDEEGATARESSQQIRPFDIRSSALVNGGGTGLVVVAPDAPKKAELEDIRHILKLAPGPLLGVVTYTGGPSPQRDHRREHRVNGNGNGGET